MSHPVLIPKNSRTPLPPTPSLSLPPFRGHINLFKFTHICSVPHGGTDIHILPLPPTINSSPKNVCPFAEWHLACRMFSRGKEGGRAIAPFFICRGISASLFAGHVTDITGSQYYDDDDGEDDRVRGCERVRRHMQNDNCY